MIVVRMKVNFAEREQMCEDRSCEKRQPIKLGVASWDVMTKVKPGSVARSPEPARYKKINAEGAKAAAAWCE